MRVIKFEYLFENIQEDGRSIVKQNWTLEQIESNELIYEKQILIAKRQYTGLKDKNDVEIYEGDIVQVEGLGVGIIEYIESYFRIFKPYIFSVNLCNYTSTIELEPKNKVEVIGNIYENQDLLKELNNG